MKVKSLDYSKNNFGIIKKGVYMKELFKRYNIFKAIMSAVLIILGICLICIPNATLLSICYFAAGFVVFYGVCSVVNYFIYSIEPYGFIKGLCATTLGIVAIIFAPQIVSAHVFAVIVGIFLLVSGFVKIQTAMDYRSYGFKFWWTNLIYSAVLVVYSIVMMCYPFQAQRIFLIVFGVELVVDGIMEMVSLFVLKGKVRKLKNKIKDELNGNIIDVDDQSKN